MNRRQLLATGAMAATAYPLAALASATTRTQGALDIDPLSLVSPDLREPLARWRQKPGDSPISAQTLARARRMSEPKSAPAPAPRCEQRSIPGRKGMPVVRVFVINAAASGAQLPAILHIHGGGFVAGTADEVIPNLQRLAQEHNCVIVTVDYRLAPETRFPGSLEDNYTALQWLFRSAQSLGVDPSRIAVAGESAGGGHAAMLAIAAHNRGEVPITFQLLIYPMLDDRTGSSRPGPPYIGAYIWGPESNRFGWSSLLGVPAGSIVVPEGAVPARTHSVAGLPPAFIGVGSIDLFVAEGIEYARRLIDSGVPTELCVVPGAYHGFDIIAPDASTSMRFRATCSAALRKAFEHT